jgi:NitT/TauT family transport system substrate-binding protein
MKRTRLFLSACLILSALSVWAETPLRVGILPDNDSLPLLAASMQGFFSAAGLEVKLETFRSARDRDSALQAGAIDGAVSDLLAVAFARNAGFEAYAVARTDGDYRLLVSPSSGIASTTDLRGRLVAISRNTIIEYATDRIAAAGGLLPGEFRKVEIPNIPTRLEMLEAGKIDAATLPEPLATTAVLGGAREISSAKKVGLDAGVIVFTGSAISTRSNDIAAFFAAYDRAVAFLDSGLSETELAALYLKAGFPEGSVSNLTLPVYSPSSLPRRTAVDDVLSWLLERGLVSSRFPYDDIVRSVKR